MPTPRPTATPTVGKLSSLPPPPPAAAAVAAVDPLQLGREGLSLQ